MIPITRRRAALVTFLASYFPHRISAQSFAQSPDTSTCRPIMLTASKQAEWLTLPPTPTLPIATRSGLASINDNSVFFAQFGSGPPVMLLHGGLASSNYWGNQIKKLSDDFTVTVMDTRGHGRSPVMSGEFSYVKFAEDAVGLMDFLGIKVFSLVGWSDGAITGLQLAMTKPERISRLFAFGTNSSVDGLRMGGSRSSTFLSYVARCKNEYALLSPRPDRWPILVRGLRNMWRYEPNFTKRNLAAIKVPTTVCDGEYDEIIKREHTNEIASQIPGARLVILTNVCHFAMLQQPTQFNQAIIQFLAL